MTTEVHQQPQAPVEDAPVDDLPRARLPHELNTWLNLPPAELELHAISFMEALEKTAIPEHERASVAGALLDLLESPRFGTSIAEGRSLRGVAVEAVLRIGYPWALQLEPDDLTAAREEVRRLRPLVSWRRIGVAVALIVALGAGVGGVLTTLMSSGAATAAERAEKPYGRTFKFGGAVKEDPAAITETVVLPPASETAVRVATLRAEGLTSLALAVGEACVVGYGIPRPCVQEVARLAQDLAERSNDEFDLYRAKQWKRLIDEQNPLRVREQARFLFENEFARDASFLSPGGDQKALMRFVEQASRYEAQGLARPLQTLTNDCASKTGQFGMICRDFSARAQRMVEATHAFEQVPALPVGQAEREGGMVRRIIQLRLDDRIDDAITEATICATANSRLSADCSNVLADLYQRRYQDKGLEADRQAAERWRPKPQAP